MLPIHLDLPDTMAAVITARAAAHGTTPELYLLALIERVLLEESLSRRPGRGPQRLIRALHDDVLPQSTAHPTGQ